jgi:glycosyltransferase involved in cell wall biosynthesis
VINIIYLHPHFTHPGGAGNVVLESASRLNPEKYKVHILCIRADSHYKKRYSSLYFIEIGGPLSSSILFWLTFPFVQYKVHRELNRFGFKTIFPHVFPSNWWAFIYRILHKDAICFWYCHEPSAFIHSSQWIESISNPIMRIGAKLINPLLKTIDLLLVRKGIDHVICNSKFTKKHFSKIYQKQVACCIYPGIDLNYFCTKKSKKQYLFMLCRLTKFKNVHIAIEAMKKIENKDYKLIIGGEGEEKNNLIALTNKLNLSDKIIFIGQVASNELPKLYAEAKLVLFTNYHEPFGLVPIEALACGTPVAGVKSGGLKETLKHNYNSVLLNDMNPESLAKIINELLSDSCKYRTLQQNSRRSVEAFSWDRHVYRLEKIFNALIFN